MLASDIQTASTEFLKMFAQFPHVSHTTTNLSKIMILTLKSEHETLSGVLDSNHAGDAEKVLVSC